MYADHTHTIADVESRLRNSIRAQVGPRNCAPRVRSETESKFRFYGGPRAWPSVSRGFPALIPLVGSDDHRVMFVTRTIIFSSAYFSIFGEKEKKEENYARRRPCARAKIPQDSRAQSTGFPCGKREHSPISPTGLSLLTNLG